MPPKPIRELRDLTRYRKTIIYERTRETQRLEKVLEDAGIKLSSVASDILGVSGRAMLDALVAGTHDPEILADLAKRKLRRKIPQLREALEGRFRPHHALLVGEMLTRIDSANATIDRLSAEIDQRMQPFRQVTELLITIPGVSHRTCEVLIAETGGDMTHFPSADHLASWAGMCPGNNESAGRHFTGRTRKGDRWLRGGLGEAAAAAARTRNSYLSTRYRRLAGRRGKKKAQVAIGHDILLASWYILTRDIDYQDLGGDYFDTHVMDPGRKVTRLTQQLQALGYRVTLEHAA